jgi:hypothetical protein
MNEGKWPFLILVKYATRGRPDRFFDGMNTIYNLCSQPDYIRVLITADEDDPSMNNIAVKEKIATYKNAEVIYGSSKNKIHATNRDLDKLPKGWEKWDIITNFSDDQRWTIYGWDDLIRVDFNAVSPDFSHYIAYLDVDTKSALSTLYIAGRKFFDMFGFVYDEMFVSLFADNLVEDVAKAVGKYHYTGYTIYQHLCPSYGHLPEDLQFRQQQDLGWTLDYTTYYALKAQGIDSYIAKILNQPK